MSILILGNANEVHVVAIRERLEKAGENVFVLNTRRYPWEVKITFSPDELSEGEITDSVSKQRIPMSEFTAAWWRTHMGYQVPELLKGKNINLDDYDRVMASFLNSRTNWRWVNSPAAIAEHRLKIFQMALIAQAGVRIPRTLVTGNVNQLKAFLDSCGSVVYKSPGGAGEVRQLVESDFAPKRIAPMLISSLQYQELIPGTDIAVYLVGETVFATEIISDALDFRQDKSRQLKPIKLPDDIVQKCIEVSKLVKQPWSLIDIRRTPEGEHVFIEANPSPKFLDYEQATGYPIGETLANYLMGNG